MTGEIQQDSLYLKVDDVDETLAFTTAVAHPGGTIEITCTEEHGDFDVFSASLSGIKVDSLG